MPHQCAHWFAMTCRRRGRGYVCKDVSAMDTLGRGRGLPRRGAAAPLLAMTCRREQGVYGCKDVPLCHCEERSDVAIRSPCDSA